MWEVLTEAHEELKDRIAAAKDFRHATGEYKLDRTPSPEVNTAVSADRLDVLNDELLTVPDAFTIHPKLAASLRSAARRSAADGAGQGIRGRTPRRWPSRRCSPRESRSA